MKERSVTERWERRPGWDDRHHRGQDGCLYSDEQETKLEFVDTQLENQEHDDGSSDD